MKRKRDQSVYEQHYYKEVGKRIVPIEEEKEKRRIDRFLERHAVTPPATARESGYSAYMFHGDAVVNTAVVKRKRIGEGCSLITRASRAPALPVSCLATTEHVVAMGDEVTDFKSEHEPKAKAKVMYHISLRCNAKLFAIRKEKRAILALIKEFDDTLDDDDIDIGFNIRKGIFEIKTSTQIADIQILVRALTSDKRYSILNCDFADIGLNEGVCLVKRDASNPIHALVNVVDSAAKKGFIERDAGTTTGLLTSAYQDRHWTFNFFTSLKEMRERTDYPATALAIKIASGV